MTEANIRAAHVMNELIEKAIHLMRENKKDWQQCMDEAFDLIDHSPYNSRKELSEAHTIATDAACERLRATLEKRKNNELQS